MNKTWNLPIPPPPTYTRCKCGGAIIYGRCEDCQPETDEERRLAEDADRYAEMVKIEESPEMPELKRRFDLWCYEHGTTTQLALEWAVMLFIAGQLQPPPKDASA